MQNRKINRKLCWTKMTMLRRNLLKKKKIISSIYCPGFNQAEWTINVVRSIQSAIQSIEQSHQKYQTWKTSM